MQRHANEAWAVANLEVEIGPIEKTGNATVDEFNQLVMDAFNVGSGNLLTPGNVLTWNVWFEEPTLVDRKEWQEHAEKWRESIDADHGAPTGPGTLPRYFDGAPFLAAEAVLEEITNAIIIGSRTTCRSSRKPADALPPWLRRYNWRRPHGGAKIPDTHQSVPPPVAQLCRLEHNGRAMATDPTADRTSCSRATANQFRLFLHARPTG